MYKPANVREFTTTATHKKSTASLVNGRTVNVYSTVGTIRGKFKQKGSTDKDVNGLTLVNTTTTFVTWWASNFAASDLIVINGIDYCIIGEVENVEMRNRYAILTLEKVIANG